MSGPSVLQCLTRGLKSNVTVIILQWSVQKCFIKKHLWVVNLDWIFLMIDYVSSSSEVEFYVSCRRKQIEQKTGLSLRPIAETIMKPITCLIYVFLKLANWRKSISEIVHYTIFIIRFLSIFSIFCTIKYPFKNKRTWT